MPTYNREVVIRMSDIRAVAQCSRGAREFFRIHNLDWADFLKNGIDCGTIMDLDDVMAMQVVEYANGRR